MARRLSSSPEHAAAELDELSRVIGQRMGVDPTADPRPYLVASIALNAVQTAANAWRRHHPDVRAPELLGRFFDLLRDGLDYPAPGRDPGGAAAVGPAGGR